MSLEDREDKGVEQDEDLTLPRELPCKITTEPHSWVGSLWTGYAFFGTANPYIEGAPRGVW